MDVTINAIKFNHDTESAKNDAITIRKNETCDVAVPEWEVDENGKLHTSAAAYARSVRTNLRIAVQLKRLNPAVQRVEVSTESKGLFGTSVKATEIIFSRRDDLSHFAVIEFQNTTLSSAVVRRSEIELEWSFRVTLNNGQQPDTPPQRTKHVIYTLLGPPKPPWAPDEESRDFEHPWTDVLDLVCRWADGARDTTEVATRITTSLYALGPRKLKYVLARGDSVLSILGTDRFKCTMFLQHLKSGTHPLRIDCTDCAILVSSFANIVGCDLYQSEMGSTMDFSTNPIRVIGARPNNEKNFPFTYHEAAWEYPCDSTARLFDCCLQVDGDTNPSGGEFDPLLPVNIRFGNPASGDYHFRLVQRGQACEPRPGTKTRRRIARQKFLVRRIHPDLEQLLKERLDYTSWEKTPSPEKLFSGPVESISDKFIPEGWNLDQLRILIGEVDKMSLTETIWQSTTSNNVALQLIIYKCSSVSAAREFLLNLLGGFQLPVIRRRIDFEKNSERVAIGDVAFSVPEDLALLFARSNLVIFIQNTGRATPSVSGFAHDTDERIVSLLRAEESAQETTDSTSTLEKEKNEMFIELEGTRWSSNRPRKNGTPNDTPNDTRPDGVFEFDKYNQGTGEAEGTYYDVFAHKTIRFEGTVKFNGSNSHFFVLSHVFLDNTDFKRLYQGQIVADDTRVTVVAGQWRLIDNAESISEESRQAALAANNGQVEGVWVATKP